MGSRDPAPAPDFSHIKPRRRPPPPKTQQAPPEPPAPRDTPEPPAKTVRGGKAKDRLGGGGSDTLADRVAAAVARQDGIPRGSNASMAGLFDTPEQARARQDPKSPFAVNEEPQAYVVEEDPPAGETARRRERLAALNERARALREAEQARQRAKQEKAARERAKALREARERAVQDKALGSREAAERAARARIDENRAQNPGGRREGRDDTPTSQFGGRILDLAKQHEARLRELGQHPDQNQALGGRESAERAARQRVFDTRPLDARETIKSVQDGDGRREQNVTHDLLRQVMASKAYANRVPEVVDFVRAGFEALYPGNVPRDATGKAQPTQPREGVTLGAVMDAMGVSSSGSLAAAELGGQQRQASDPFNADWRHDQSEAAVRRVMDGHATPEQTQQVVDLMAQQINQDIAQRAKTLGRVPARVRGWVEAALVTGDAETAVHAVDLLDRLHSTVPGYDDGIDKTALQIAETIRASRRGNLYGTAEEWVENARRPYAQEAPAAPEYPAGLKGTTFFGGAGMEGAYIDDFVRALEEAGIENVRAADRSKWSGGGFSDAWDALTERNRDEEFSDLSAMGTDGEQFNLVGFSYGGLQAAQAAADYTDQGGKVDNVVLIGTPIGPEFLQELRSNPNIGEVIVVDLEDEGDPIRAGMGTGEMISTLPELGGEFSGRHAVDYTGGHFYYGGDDDEGRSRRANWPKIWSLRG